MVSALLSSCLLATTGLTLQKAEGVLSYPQPLPLGGYTERRDRVMEPGGEDLWVRVAILSQSGGQSVTLVSFEGLTIPESLRDRVREEIGGDTVLFLAATHTHCAPDTQMLNSRMTFKIPGIATYQRRWLDATVQQIGAVVKRASGSPATPITSLSLVSAEFSGNRGRRPGAWVDPTAWEIRANGANLWTIFAAHPTFWGAERNQTSGDWPGAVAKARGSLVMTGPIGDASPVAAGSSPSERIANFTQGLSGALNKGSERDLAPRLAAKVVTVDLGKPTPHPEFLTSNKIEASLGNLIIARFAPPTAEITLLALGDLLVVGIPGEPTQAVAQQMKVAAKRAGFRDGVVISHVNGWMGYILLPADYARGGYEATLAFHGSQISTKLVEAVASGARDLATSSR